MYKLIFDNLNNKQSGILRLSDGACIPLDEANTDYQAYLKFLEDGGIPEPADELTNN